eukprot:m.94343 g.94343  ORF g.94343 m.94343 type:complete len:298 (-) comp26712_c1_seq1:229-1122(-)
MVLLKVAAAQFPEVMAASSESVSLHRTLAMTAKKEGAHLVVFPEMSLTGYSIGAQEIRRRAQSQTGPLLTQVREIAKEVGIALCVGYAERPDDGNGQLGNHIYNSAVVVDREGHIIHNYRKTHLYGDYEFSVFSSGGVGELRVSTFKVDNDVSIRFGVMVCMDCEYPEPARVLALQGAQLIVLPTAMAYGPMQPITPEHIVLTRAVENHVFIAYSNFNGAAADPDYPVLCGRSAIIGPDGVTLTRAPGFESHHRGATGCVSVISAVVDPEAFAADLIRNPYLTARRPKLYSVLGAKL